MGIELKQSTNAPTPSANFTEDSFGARVLHMAANSRNYATLSVKITQTSPATITGMGGDATPSLPSGAIPTAIRFWGKVGAATALATISLGIDTTSTYFLSAVTVSGAAGGTGQFTPNAATNLWLALATLPVGQAHSVTGSYAEAGTSGSGGPWYVDIDYYVPDPA